MSDDFCWVTDDDELNEKLNEEDIRYIFFLHWNWLVPENVWSKYQFICFICLMSLMGAVEVLFKT
jgi:methionyl-tRNA formyltransferase